RKWRPRRRPRVVDDLRELREIAIPHLQRGNGDDDGNALRLTISLVIDEEERLVCVDRSAEAAAKLLLAHNWLCRRKEQPRVEAIVSREVERGAVVLVAAGFGDDVNDAAEGTARFGRVYVRLNLDLGNRVDRRLDAHGADGALVVVHTVDKLVVQHVVDAVDRDRRCLPPLIGARAVGKRAQRTLTRTRNHLHHPDDVASWN